MPKISRYLLLSKTVDIPIHIRNIAIDGFVGSLGWSFLCIHWKSLSSYILRNRLENNTG